MGQRLSLDKMPGLLLHEALANPAGRLCCAAYSCKTRTDSQARW